MTKKNDSPAVLLPAGISPAGQAARRRLDRIHMAKGIAVALLFHLLIVLGFWLYDILRIRDIGEWSGPVLVKIGVPDAPQSPLPDPGILPERIEDQAVVEPSQAPKEPDAENAPSNSAPPKTERAADVPRNEPVKKDGTGTAPNAAESTPAPSANSSVPKQPPPARVRGSEEGNNYLIDFEGSEDEVGRAGAYDYITSYMPLPEVLPSGLVEGASEYLKMSPEFIRSEIEVYWEKVYGEYVKKRGTSGVVPLADRPYYWGILANSLRFNPADADWRTAGMRPVEIEFTVKPSKGSSGAELDNFKFIRRSNNPSVDEAVVYGLSRWIYYNKSDRDVKARIVYDFSD